MQLIHRWMPLAILSSCLALGCTGRPPVAPPNEETKIGAALDKLDPEDRRLAEAQKYCAVEPENRLGKMGKPFKVTVKNQPVFLCCKGCETAALKDPEKTLAAVRQLKAANETPSKK